jgi:hypothetical protein
MWGSIWGKLQEHQFYLIISIVVGGKTVPRTVFCSAALPHTRPSHEKRKTPRGNVIIRDGTPTGQWDAQEHATQWLWTYNNDRPVALSWFAGKP